MLDKICQLARYAGHSILKFYHSTEDINITYKSDQTPVTNVDQTINTIIKKGLLSIDPNIPVISEEENYDFNISRNWNDYWLIDPLDGTKEFLKKNGEFTVNISLIKNSVPILGVIHVPVSDILYYAYKNHAWKESKLGIKEKINTSSLNIPPLLLISRSHADKELKNYLKKIKHHKIKKLGSSLKFCLIAEGTAQLYPKFGNTYIWDTAAGHAIVVAAGGKVVTWTNKTLNYSLSNRSSFINPGFYVSA